jgi:hypothetical protein
MEELDQLEQKQAIKQKISSYTIGQTRQHE